MNYAIKFSYCYVAITAAMCLDNICWIPDAPEYPSIKKNFKEIILLNRIFAFPINKEGFSYVWNKRILEVIKHPRDIIPATISSAILGVIL
jgi:hypothetical protein